MQKWSFFSVGIMAGIIAVLLTVIIMQNREPAAYGMAPNNVDNTGAGMLMGVGGSAPQQSDILWVLWKHPAVKRPGADPTKDITASKDERLTLCCYQVANGARTVKMVAVRDITFDMDIVEYGNDKPHVRDIIEELKRQQPKDR